MKSKNANKSSAKTRKLIKSTFAELFAEKRELGKISVSELCKRADISRGAFYSHYDDIYCVAEEYEDEIINTLFNDEFLTAIINANDFIDNFFAFLRANDENYRLLCKSDEIIFSAKRLSKIARAKIIQLCNENPIIKNKKQLELDICIFVDGLVCEYVRMCRGHSESTSEDLQEYTKSWIAEFVKRRS